MNEPVKSINVRIRRMQLDDLPQVVEIDRSSFSLPWPTNAYRFELLENPNSLAYVAERIAPSAEPIVIGLCVIWLILDEAHVATLATHPDYRRLGIARRLLIQALLDSIQRGSASATLEVRAGNQAAQALYREFGFEVVGGRPKYYQDNHEDALIMTVSPLGTAYQTWLMDISAKLDQYHLNELPQTLRSTD